MFMTANQLAECLEEKRSTFDMRLSRNPKLKTPEFSVSHKLLGTDGKYYNTRIFNEDGIYEITMLSESEKGEEFRSWVRKVLKSLRKGETTLINTDKLTAMKIQAQQDRAKAMLLNAKNRTLKTLMSTIADKKLSPIAVEVFGLKSIQEVTGIDVGNMLPECENTYSATEVGKMLDITANRVGKIANAHNLKTDEYGVMVMDKSKYSSKEIPNFRYNQRGIDKIKEIIVAIK